MESESKIIIATRRREVEEAGPDSMAGKDLMSILRQCRCDFGEDRTDEILEQYELAWATRRTPCRNLS